jgi:transposase
MTKIKYDENLQIETLQAAGLGYRKIAKQLKINTNTVKQHIRRKNLISNLPPKVVVYKGAIQGRSPLQIKTYLFENPTATLQQIIAALDLNVSTSTLSRYLKHIGFERRAGAFGPLLRDVNRVKRLEFCRRMIVKDDEYLNSIFWTDEFTVQTWPNGEILFYWTPRDSTVHDYLVSAKVQNGGTRVMFWGNMTFHAYGPLVTLEGSQNQHTYIQLLKDYVIPEFEASEVELEFQQDNAPCHVAGTVKDFFRQQSMEVVDWPPQSPDLSPIEWFWNIIKQKLKILKSRPRTKHELIEAVHKLWAESLDDEVRKKVIVGFRRRLAECIELDGRLTKN